MKKLLIAAGIAVLAAGAWFTYVMYKVGEEMYSHRCGCWNNRDWIA